MITHEAVKNHIQSNTLKRNMLPQSTNRITKSCIQTNIKKRAKVIDATSSEGFLVSQKTICRRGIIEFALTATRTTFDFAQLQYIIAKSTTTSKNV